MEGKNTKDYVKLAAPMKLPEFAVDFPYYPWLSAIKPFERWVHTDSPSQGLGWYAAYNNVKHDRESKFAEATLHCAFQAISGCFVMLCAQYGWDFALRGGGASLMCVSPASHGAAMGASRSVCAAASWRIDSQAVSIQPVGGRKDITLRKRSGMPDNGAPACRVRICTTTVADCCRSREVGSF